MSIHRLIAVIIAASAALHAQNGIEFTAADIPIGAPIVSSIGARIAGTSRRELLTIATTPARVIVTNLDTNGTTTVALANAPAFVAAADLDGDGDDDIIVVSTALTNGAAVLSVLMNSNGAFTVTNYGTPTSRNPSIADLDGDQDKDVVVGRTLFINNGQGAFTNGPVQNAAAAAPDLMPGDFDGDGDQDLIGIFDGNTAAGIGATYRILSNVGGLSYSVTPLTLLTTEVTGTIAVGDVNGDGRSDLVRSFAPTILTAEFRTYRSDGAFGFIAGTPYRIGNSNVLSSLSLGDADQDGILDMLATTTQNIGPVPVPFLLVGDGQGGFIPPHGPLFSAGMVASDRRGPYLFADMNDDAKLDVIGAATQANGAITIAAIYTNSGPVMPPSADAVFSFTTPAITVTTGSSVNLPLAATLPSGIPALGQHAFLSASIVGAAPTLSFGSGADHVVTGTSGLVTLNFTSGPNTGTITITATAPNGQSTSAVVTVVPAIDIVSGNQQTAHPSEVFALPLTVVAYPQSSVAGAQTTVNFTSIGEVPVTFESPASVLTDAQNLASVLVRAGPTAGTARVRAMTGVLRFVEFDLTIGGAPRLEVVGTSPAVGTLGSTIAPLTIYADDGQGLPFANAVLNLAVVNGSVTLAQTTVTTDAAGLATITAAPGTTPGAATIRASSPIGIVDAPVFVRGLTVSMAPTIIVMQYRHENGYTPLIVAADAPMPAPGWVSSFYGNLYTSILSPGPAFFALDGIGLFGPADPSITTNAAGVFQRIFTRPNPALGLAFALQVYGYDFHYDYPANVIVSNGVIVNL